jgi:hypothetical protein
MTITLVFDAMRCATGSYGITPSKVVVLRALDVLL